MSKEETQQLLIAALVERVMALETWRENIEREEKGAKEQ